MTVRRVVRLPALLVLLGLPGHLSAQARATPPAPRDTTTAATSLDFANARLADVLRTLATLLGRTVILTDIPDVRVTFSTPAGIARPELERVLEALLEAHGLMLVPSGMVAQVMPSDKAPAAGALRTGFAFPDPPPLGLVSQLVPLQSIRADEGADALRAVLAKGARVEIVARSNALLITDRGRNIARYLELLQTLDAAPAGEAGLRTYVMNLKYAAAEDLASAIGQLFGVTVANGSGGSLSDRSLSRALDTFRTRDAETFRTRTNASGASAATTVAPSAPRDSAAGLLVGRTTVVANGPTNSLVIRTAPPNFPMLRETILALDTRPAQVLFEVTIAEIALGRGSEFGVDWAAVNRGGDVDASFGNPEKPDTGSSSALLRLVRLQNGTGVRTLLRTIASKSDVRVLSSPELIAANNREASILVGSKVPFISSTRLGNDISIDRAVQYQDVGTKLSIIPTINDDGYVSVQLLQEVSSLTQQTVAAALSAPVISTREANTRAILRDGQTVVIAGLIGDTRQTEDAGVPLLKDIPFLGALFKRQSTRHQRTELAIFVTPYIVRNDADADAIRERVKQRMQERSPGSLDDTPLAAPVKRPPGGK
jgi:general secretion pathway protein D